MQRDSCVLAQQSARVRSPLSWGARKRLSMQVRSHMEAAARELARQSQRELEREYGEMRAASQAMPDAWPDAQGPGDIANAAQPESAVPGPGPEPHPRSTAAGPAGCDAGGPDQAAPPGPGPPHGSMAVDMEDWGGSGGPPGLRGGPLGWRQATSAVWDGGGGGSGAAYTPHAAGAWRRMGGRRLDLDSLQDSPMGGNAEHPAPAPEAAPLGHRAAGADQDLVQASPMEGVVGQLSCLAEQPAPAAARDAGGERAHDAAAREGGAHIPQVDGADDSDGECDAAALGVQTEALARREGPSMSRDAVAASTNGSAGGAAGRGWVVPRACSAAGAGTATGAAAGDGALDAAAAPEIAESAIAASEPAIACCPADKVVIPGAAAPHQGSAAAGIGEGHGRAPVPLPAAQGGQAPWAGSVLDLPPLSLTRAEAASFVRRTAQLSAAVRAALALSTSSSNADASALGPTSRTLAGADHAPDLLAGQAAGTLGSKLAPAAMAPAVPVPQGAAAAGQGPGSGLRGAHTSAGVSPSPGDAGDASIPTTQEEPGPAEAATVEVGQAAAAGGALPGTRHASPPGAAPAPACSQGLGVAHAQRTGADSLTSRSPAAPVAHRTLGGSPAMGPARAEWTGHDRQVRNMPVVPLERDAESERLVPAPLVRLNLTLSPSTEASAHVGSQPAGVASPSIAPAAAPGAPGAGPKNPQTAAPHVAAGGDGATGSRAASAGGSPQVPWQAHGPASRGSDQASQGVLGTQANHGAVSQGAGHSAGPGSVPEQPLQLPVAPPLLPAQAAPAVSASLEQRSEAQMVEDPDGADQGFVQGPGSGAQAPDPMSGYGVVGDPWQGADARPEGWESDSGSFGDVSLKGAARGSGGAGSAGRTLVAYRPRERPPLQVGPSSPC